MSAEAYSLASFVSFGTAYWAGYAVHGRRYALSCVIVAIGTVAQVLAERLAS